MQVINLCHLKIISQLPPHQSLDPRCKIYHEGGGGGIGKGEGIWEESVKPGYRLGQGGLFFKK